MSIKVYLTEEEIMSTPNDFELGEMIRKKFWIEKEHDSIRDYDDEKYIVVTDDSGLVTGLHLPHEDEFTSNGYDKCVICGKVSPYLTTTSIDLRSGYVEGAGQGCFQKNICGRNN